MPNIDGFEDDWISDAVSSVVPEDRDLPDELLVAGTLISEVALYAREKANEVVVRIISGSSSTRMIVAIQMKINVDIPRDDEAAELKLCESWSDWPPNKLVKDTRNLPLLVWDLKAPEWVKVEMGEQRTTFSVDLVQMGNARSELAAKPIEIKFNTSNAFFAVPPRHMRAPLGLLRLRSRFRFSSICSEKTIVHLEYPPNISTRWRSDTASYYALSLGLGDSYRRNSSLFPRRNVRLDYLFGSNDPVELSGPGFVILRAGIGAMASGFALHLIGMNSFFGMASSPLNLVTATLALGFAPWFIEAFRRRSIFSASSIIHRYGFDDLAMLISGSCMLVVISGTIWTLGWAPEHRTFLSPLFFFGGLFLVLVAWLYMFLLWLGTLHGYRCDRCDRRIIVRRKVFKWGARLDPTSRQGLCPICAHGQPEPWMSGSDFLRGRQGRAELCILLRGLR